MRIKKMTIIMLVVLLSLSQVALCTSAVSYSDADGDGICEPGEEITFVGDLTYTDPNGGVHEYSTWDWDFNNDGAYEANGRIQVKTFAEPGNYIIKLVQMNGDAIYITLTIEVKHDEPEPDFPCEHEKFVKLIEFLAQKPVPTRILVKLIVYHLVKRHDMDRDDIDTDAINDYLEEIRENKPPCWHMKCKNKCKCK